MHHNNFFGKVFEVGEQVMAKPKRRLRGTRGDGSGSLKARWVDATWVGWDDRTGEHLVILAGGSCAVRVRSVRPVPEAERWNREAVLAIRATPNVMNFKEC